jgi:energy-coupling factor transport system substrate-specific component
MDTLKRWLGRQFTTRTIVLMPVAIAINIVLGYTTQSVLKLPIYLDSIGTILTGVLCGPLPGAVTGLLTNVIWQYSPGIGASSNIGPFAGTAALIGLLAGIWGYLGVFKPRPGSLWRLAIPTGVAVGVIALLAWRIYANTAYADVYPTWVYAAIVTIGVVAAVAVAAFVFVRRDAAGAWVAVAGAITGVVAAVASAPVAAYVYGGVTGSGTDVIVAALRQGGADVYNASLGQGLISDPIDKTITSFVVLVVLAQFSGRFLARFPLGERLVPGGIAADKRAVDKG